MRDEPSDNLAEWWGVRVEGGRVTRLYWTEDWRGEPLTGTIPAGIGALDGLTYLGLDDNQIAATCPRRSAHSPPSDLFGSAVIASKALSLLSSEHLPPLPISAFKITTSLGRSLPASRTLPTSRTSASTATISTPTFHPSCAITRMSRFSSPRLRSNEYVYFVNLVTIS